MTYNICRICCDKNLNRLILNGYTWFLLQVDELEEEKKVVFVRLKRKEKFEKRFKRKDVLDKYKGYEIFLDVDEDFDFYVFKGLF